MLSRLLARVQPYAVELLVMLCAIWAAICLFNRPSNMLGPFANYYRFMGRIEGSERFWAETAVSGGGALLAGLALSPWHLLSGLSIALRIVGLSIAGCFFVILGSSWLAQSLDSVGGGMAVAIGLAAWSVLLRTPALPGGLR